MASTKGVLRLHVYAQPRTPSVTALTRRATSPYKVEEVSFRNGVCLASTSTS